MPEEQQPEVTAFAEYSCSLGTVINHEAGSYHIRTPDGRVIGVVAKGELSAENVEGDIATPGTVSPSDEQIYAEHLAAGFDDPVTGLKLKTVERAQAKFGRMCTLIDLGVSQGVMTSESTVTLFDFNEAPHELTVTAFRALMLRYGLHCKTVFDLYAP